MAMAVSRSEAGTGEKVMLRGSDMVSERSRWEKQEKREEQGESDARSDASMMYGLVMWGKWTHKFQLV